MVERAAVMLPWDSDAGSLLSSEARYSRSIKLSAYCVAVSNCWEERE